MHLLPHLRPTGTSIGTRDLKVGAAGVKFGYRVFGLSSRKNGGIRFWAGLRLALVRAGGLILEGTDTLGERSTSLRQAGGGCVAGLGREQRFDR